MSHYKYELLSAQDNDFLLWEQPNLPMHGGGVQVFERGPLAIPDGGVDFATIRRGIESVLPRIPRYRQKLAWIPGQERAVWVDDPHFNIDYHMRHTALARPGTERELKQLAARVIERPLDRLRPLWEMWVVEGLDADRFAIITKTHHCMLDGISGMNLATILMSDDPEHRFSDAPRYVPRPLPSDAELRRDAIVRRLGMPLDVLRGLRDFTASTDDVVGEVTTRLRALAQMAWWKAVSSSDTPLNGPVGPHRSIDWMSIRLDDMKAVRKALGCSINDVVLATVTGAVRQFMISRQVHPDELDFRTATPVSVRAGSEQGQLGNRVSSWIVRLPVGEPDPKRQVEKIRETTKELKRSHQSAAIEMIETVHEWVRFDLQSLAKGTQNMFVTNMPGPQFPLYMMGARQQMMYGMAPLLENLGLVVGVMSYDGEVCWGFNADYDRVPDLAEFVGLVRSSFASLAAAAGVELAAA
ncbi:MAG: wax ester/triacylglycerol synthase family O-acyltransferase [Deltaproteobacteria bacterium]|nr:wax ester/triacylglycerol synthase family O-acyltransferase [Deltaproteobacteria bacterium]MBW2363213.1 wax ester/triacylglycerol synthase family O-acyltransferase [Deltaproteobacteria bacterium]